VRDAAHKARDGSTMTFVVSDPGSSVAVRDKPNRVEYLGSPTPNVYSSRVNLWAIFTVRIFNTIA
jgi:hypothetical protein